MADGSVEVLETNPYLTSEYLLDVTGEDLQNSGMISSTKVIPDSDACYPGCTEHLLTPSVGRTIASVVVSPDTGKVYLKSRYGDGRDAAYLAMINREIRAALLAKKV